MKKPDVIAIYLRVSLEDDEVRAGIRDESCTIGNQRSIVRNFIAGKPEFQNSEIHEFCDDGYTGTNFERPGIQALLADAKSKKTGCVIVKDFSRFGRDYLQVSDYIDQIFPFLGIRFISINDNYDSLEYDGVTSGVDIAFRNVVYAYYSKDISDKVRSGLRVKAQRGEYINSYAPFGYRKNEHNKNQLVADARPAEVVRQIFRLAESGMSTTKIAYQLNLEGIPSPSQFKKEQGLSHKYWDRMANGRGMFWSSNAVAYIIRDERYLGKIVYGKESNIEIGKRKGKKNAANTWIVVQDCHEPLVSLEMFQKAQKTIKKKEAIPVYNAEKSLFSGKLRCGVCKFALIKAGKEKVRYRCRTKRRTPVFNCMPGAIYEKELAAVVWEAIEKYCRVRLDQQASVKKNSDLSKRVLKLQNQIKVCQLELKRIEEKKAALYEKMLDGDCDRAVYIKERDILSGKGEEQNKEICTFEMQLVSLRQESSETPRIQMMQNCLQSEFLTREILNAFVDCIYVYSDKSIEIQWLFE